METNAEYIDRCISAYLYNSPLVSRKDLMTFHNSRELQDDARLEMFNNIVSAAIDCSQNLILEYKTEGGETPEEIKAAFMSSWDPDKYASAQQPSSEGVPVLAGPSAPRKVQKIQKEHMSGGKVWTMDNGFKVIVKNMPSDGHVRYSLLLNGGYANVPDLKQGEGAYFSDILALSRIGGVSSEKFLDVARQSGVTVDFNVDISSTSFHGTVKEDHIDRLMSLLLTMLNDREIDKDELDYHMKCELLKKEYLRDSEREKMGEISKIMFPDYIHTPIREASSLSPEFAQKAEKFMDAQSAKVNDGVLILVGNVNERALKSALQMYAGGFCTTERTFTKPVVSYQPIAGTATRSVLGNASEIDVVMSTPLSLTAENYYAASLASMALRKAMATELLDSGMSLMVRYDCRRSPQGRYNLFLRLGEANPEGYAPGSVHGDQLQALESVREVLDNMGSLEVRPEDLNIYKAILKKRVNDMKNTPEYWLRAISMRYTDGKDFTNGSDGWIDSVSPAKVKSLLCNLAEGTRVEYLTIRK
jgi:predicted Zn-dependent peptidase